MDLLHRCAGLFLEALGKLWSRGGREGRRLEEGAETKDG